MPEYQTATVTSHKIPATTYHLITLSPEDDNFSYKAGQYITIKVLDNKIKHYSIASKPGQKEIELIVNTKPGKSGSQYLESLQVGDKVQFLGPLGNFVYQHDEEPDEIVFVATGAGIAPIKSMLEETLYSHRDHRPIHLYFGLRKDEDMFLDEYLHQLEKSFDNFVYHLCLSKATDKWIGRKGRVTHWFNYDFSQADHVCMYLCGNPEMIRETKAIAIAKGVPETKIYHEAFW